MKKLFNILLILSAIAFISAPVSTALYVASGYHPVASVAIVTALIAVIYFVKVPKINAFTSGIQREIWENDIVENLFKNNQFLNNAFNADQYVNQGKVVHIPNAGDAPDVVKNRSTLPATVTTRTDTDITYNLDEFTSDPIRIPYAETVELSYDKRQSVTSEAQSKLRQVIAEYMLVNWAPAAAQAIKTTGDATAATAPSATGNRKLITLADLKSAMTQMNKDSVPMEDRCALFSADMYDQFINGLTATQYRDFSQAFDEKSGILGRLYGFNIMMRSTVLIYDSSYAAKAVGATGATTDNEAVLCWQKNSVERALGEVKFFEDLGNPTYYSDIYSFLVRMGGRIRRNDKKGVLVIAQASAA